MSREDKERFLSRWSRRKLDVAKEAASPKPPPPAPAAPAAAPAVSSGRRRPSSPVDTLKGWRRSTGIPASDVDEKLRQAALKKTLSRPAFQRDGRTGHLYRRYSKPDPIPDAMLRTLSHAKGLLFDEEKEERVPAATRAADPALPETPRRRTLPPRRRRPSRSRKGKSLNGPRGPHAQALQLQQDHGARRKALAARSSSSSRSRSTRSCAASRSRVSRGR